MVLQSDTPDSQHNAPSPAHSRIDPCNTPPSHMADLTDLSPKRATRHLGVQHSSSPKRGDTSVPAVKPFRPTNPNGSSNDFGRWLLKFEIWVQTKLGTTDPGRWQPAALQQLPLLLDDDFVDTFNNRMKKNPTWTYPQITAALKEDWKGPDPLTLVQTLHDMRFEPAKENFREFCYRLRRVYFDARGDDAGEDDPELVQFALTRAPKDARDAAGIRFNLTEGTFPSDLNYYTVARFIDGYCRRHPQILNPNSLPATPSIATAVATYGDTEPTPGSSEPFLTPSPYPTPSAHGPPTFSTVATATPRQTGMTTSPTPAAAPSADFIHPGVRCYNCQGYGHYASVCPTQRHSRNHRRPFGTIRKPNADRTAAFARTHRRLKGTVNKLREDLRVALAVRPTNQPSRSRSRRRTQAPTDAEVQAYGKFFSEIMSRYHPKNE